MIIRDYLNKKVNFSYQQKKKFDAAIDVVRKNGVHKNELFVFELVNIGIHKECRYPCDIREK